MSGAWRILGKVGERESNPAWVPGSESVTPRLREDLALGVTGLYGDLPPGVGPLLEISATLTARAFDAYAKGDWERCDALIAEGCEACGWIFTDLAERVCSPAWPYRVDHPAWDDFRVRLALMVLPLDAAPPAPAAPAPPPRESEADFLERLHQLVADAEAGKRAAG
jgi:hypothetical protein